MEAAAQLHREGHELNVLVVGDGPERERLQAMAKQLDIHVHFYGACYDETRLAELNLISCVTVAPGMVGLTAMQSLGYGVPVITHDDRLAQMPEAESILPGITGDLFEHGNVADLARVLRGWSQVAQVSPQVRTACRQVIERFYHPKFQRRVIERALDGKAADDLFWQRESK